MNFIALFFPHFKHRMSVCEWYFINEFLVVLEPEQQLMDYNPKFGFQTGIKRKVFIQISLVSSENHLKLID